MYLRFGSIALSTQFRNHNQCTIPRVIDFLECIEEDIYAIVGYDFDWRRVGRRLMCDQKVRDIDHEEGSEGEKKEKMLLEWKRTKSHDKIGPGFGRPLSTTTSTARPTAAFTAVQPTRKQCTVFHVGMKTVLKEMSSRVDHSIRLILRSSSSGNIGDRHITTESNGPESQLTLQTW
ncbi:hypothetical protein EMCRGX_G004238 [Ephydatia muelleri]